MQKHEDVVGTILMMMIIIMFVANICELILLVIILSVKRETRDLLIVVREWVNFIKTMRQSDELRTGRVEQKADTLARAVVNLPKNTAAEVVDLIKSGNGKEPPS